jgi:excinuclease UvrABC ATPase subunit
MTCVTGVSGSGKSTLINRTLLPLAATQLNGATTLTAEKFDSIDGLQHLDKVVDIDQSPIGRTRSNPARIQAYLPQFVNYLRKRLKPKHVVIAQVVSRLT